MSHESIAELQRVVPSRNSEHYIGAITCVQRMTAHESLSDTAFFVTEGTLAGSSENVHFVTVVNPDNDNVLGAALIEEEPDKARVAAAYAGPTLLESGLAPALVEIAIRESKAPVVEVDLDGTNIPNEALVTKLGEHALFSNEMYGKIFALQSGAEDATSDQVVLAQAA